jgi:hypothetical protein
MYNLQRPERKTQRNNLRREKLKNNQEFSA